MAHVTVTADSVSVLRERLDLLGVAPESHGLPLAGPRVGIVMGSDSDLQTMKGAAEVLDAFGVRYELTIVSAHRTPARMFSYAQTAVERGLEVLVAGAGGAAHLPGMIAALTTLPVIGVPVSSAAFGGSDALLSIVQMPRGVPVATVAIGNGTNAGLLALRILACRDPALSAQLETYTASQEGDVLAKADRLEAVGYKQYLAEMGK
jgi:phosphoribosylaminoimidazole carboxylase